MKTRHHRSFVRGFSIVEMMVAITIGLIVLAAASSIFVTSKMNYITQESMSRLQESARVAMHIIGKDIRRAGYLGCVDDLENINSTLNSDFPYDFEIAIEGAEASTGRWYPSNEATAFPTTGTSVVSQATNCPNIVGGQCTGTDAISIRAVDPNSNISLQVAMPNTAASLFLNPDHGLQVGEVVLLSDCGSADLLQITNIQDGSGGNAGKKAIVHNSGSTPSPGNSTQKLSRAYGPPNAGIMKFLQRTYYVGTGASGQPALFRQNINGSGREELVEGIQDLQITYGAAIDGDRTPRRYLSANDASLGADKTRWTNVISVRVQFTARPVSEGATQLAVAPKQFTSTFLLRNLQ